MEPLKDVAYPLDMQTEVKTQTGVSVTVTVSRVQWGFPISNMPSAPKEAFTPKIKPLGTPSSARFREIKSPKVLR